MKIRKQDGNPHRSSKTQGLSGQRSCRPGASAECRTVPDGDGSGVEGKQRSGVAGSSALRLPREMCQIDGGAGSGKNCDPPVQMAADVPPRELERLCTDNDRHPARSGREESQGANQGRRGVWLSLAERLSLTRDCDAIPRHVSAFRISDWLLRPLLAAASFTASGRTTSAFGRDTLGGGHQQADYTGAIAQLVECSLCNREVVSSNPGRVIPKTYGKECGKVKHTALPAD
ncbi:hypothetical protein Bbelb_075020 [Branchiostoma belcheri]|nr:hypothetical protein Bbelb_075020 [Branchiostoma belcheri]